jgi:distribution and morphology protein 10
MDTFTPPAAISFTYTLNPIVGHMSASYVVQASPELVLCSRYDFSIYSYESDLAFGLEYNATKKQNEAKQDVEKLEGLIKASWGFNKGLSLMWEGKWRNALVTLGLTSDSKHPIRSIGFEIQYFS